MASVTAWIKEESLKNVSVKIRFEMRFESWMELKKTLPDNYEGHQFARLIDLALESLTKIFHEYVSEVEGGEK